MGLIASVVAIGLGLLFAAIMRGRAAALAALRRWSRWLAAALTTLFCLIFTLGVGGAIGSGDGNPVLLTLAIGLIVASLLLWRGPARNFGVAGHTLAALWILYSAFVSRHSPAASTLFTAVAIPSLFAAATEWVGERPG